MHLRRTGSRAVDCCNEQSTDKPSVVVVVVLLTVATNDPTNATPSWLEVIEMMRRLEVNEIMRRLGEERR
ncbi:hypothetical protein BVRB_5g124800 [Beta vulgaris subsp. vulgaris]|uniref:Uncharacterized protein n=1 Tax=Beta vulgaris subsp. vulgaris TaxID=3555 RepID=A0A0J8E3I0_BETVV|nr:hypothetical protein BVRB_5g124800 [Beta vulgaris subsp. vulgaris]